MYRVEKYPEKARELDDALRAQLMELIAVGEAEIL
eukprot:CAMPEP_0204376594 /NCGR_PEP_ID=MMETSP0469-20131031/50222_1 /ASSEMBLY_ACC=CAM_ASM_000384 /TAXON_ID=2969 /ORGANISM="Oxyrrhis marina" /LENGTH=34 /DNA_ID= /DNA_START= /DNA_END= /DNA_ORIENTATION=